MRSASTIEMPIVTMVWRSSWPCMKRNTETCSRNPTSAAEAKPAAMARNQLSVTSPTTQPQ